MRSLAISKRILLELLRDKRTLMLLFLAPILVLFLMSIIFNNNQTPEVKVGVVNVNSELVQKLKDTKHVKVKQYDEVTTAKQRIKDDDIDAYIKADDNKYDMVFSNTDAGKTQSVKLAFKNSLTNVSLEKMQHQLQILSHGQFKPGTPKLTIHNHYLYGNADTNFFDKILPILISFFVFFFVFLVSGMGLLKERTTGTLERLLATPVKRGEIVFGYMLSYGLLAIIQTIIIVSVTIKLLKVTLVGNVFNIMVINLILALVALSFGLLLSTFANSEFQMMQFIPIVIVPQVFFSGIIPLDTMASWVKNISYVIPIKYSGDAVTKIMTKGTSLVDLHNDISVLLGILVVLVGLNILGLKRYRKV